MTPQVFPVRFESPSGLSVEVNANGSIRRIDHGDIILNLFLGSEIEGGPANVFLRLHGASIESVPLLGPGSPAVVLLDDHGLTVRGDWKDIGFALSLSLAQSAPAWRWHATLENKTAADVVVDLIYAQDLALAHYGAVRMNEYYVSQYVDYTPLEHPRCGHVLAVRQNLSMGGRNPWALIGSLRSAVSFATDALELHGLATRAGEVADGLRLPTLPGRRRPCASSRESRLVAGSSVGSRSITRARRRPPTWHSSTAHSLCPRRSTHPEAESRKVAERPRSSVHARC